MATLIVDKQSAQLLVHRYLHLTTPTRTPGIHVSDIISDMVRLIPSLAKTLDTEEYTRDAMWMCGLMWEDAGRKVTGHHQIEMVCEGIVCTVDEIDPINAIVGEYKFSWKSTRNFNILDDWRYMTQAKAYAKAWNVRVVIFHLFHVCADYQPPFPDPTDYIIAFTDREVEENWRMLQTHAKFMRERAGAEPDGELQMLLTQTASVRP